jgi:hypothetical protein
MPRRLGLALLALALPAVARAQTAPERLLPPGSQLYLHWDGFEKHQDAYAKTAVAKTMKGDTGKFLRAAVRHALEQVNTYLGSQFDKELVQGLTDDFAGVFATVSKNGFTLAVEVRKLDPAEVQAVLVLPGAGAGPKSLPSLLRTALKLGKEEAKRESVLGRKVWHLESGPVHVAWWPEGPDAVLAVGTDAPQTLVRRLLKGKKSLADRPLYQRVRDFKEFPTWARGYVDLASLARVAAGYRPEASKLIDELGLRGLKSLTFYSGFDGPAELGVVELDLTGPRRGLLSLLSKRKFTLADLPAMPPDITDFSASNLAVGKVYPVGVRAVESVIGLFAPGRVGQVKDAIRQTETTLGARFDDLFGCFGDLVVQYSAWAEGPLGMGQVTLIQVKDAPKLEKTLAKLFQGVNNLPFLTADARTRTYHGVRLHEVRLGGPPGLPSFHWYVPTYAVHEGWFVFGYYPQPVQGYILRAKGELRAWKAGGRLRKRLEAFPKEMTGITVSDPRPTLKLVLALAPTALTVLNNVLEFTGQGGRPFDVGLVPNAYEATEHLFPNITVTTDDGKRVRSVTRSSLALPF